jgi:hypothetical protein
MTSMQQNKTPWPDKLAQNLTNSVLQLTIEQKKANTPKRKKNPNFISSA